MKARVTAGVSALWLMAALVWGMQSALGANLQGNELPLGRAVVTSLIQTVPWIPVTLMVVALSVRFPLTRTTWKRNLWIHLVALPLVTFFANVLVVLGFWINSGSFQGLGALLSGGLFWATLRIHVAALIYAAIAGVTHVVVLYRDTRARELELARLEGQLARARLQALNAQIRPHFLFNTLHTIGQLWRSGRHDDADAMLDHLGALFQKVQSTSRHPHVSLAEELEMVREYLAIEQTRFRDRLRVRVDAGDPALSWRVPPLILQPLVENAIRHGVSPTSSAECVEVTAAVEGDALVVEVRDDGVGIDGPPVGLDPPAGQAEAPAVPGTGTGLANTRERLAQLYGDQHRMEISSAPGEGTTVRLVIPAGGYDGGDGAAPPGRGGGQPSDRGAA